MTLAPIIVIEVEQGTDEQVRLVWRDRATQLPVDLTGWTGTMRISTRPLTVLTPALGADGSIVVDLPANLTTILGETTKPRFELDLVSPDGKIKRFVKGAVKIGRSLA